MKVEYRTINSEWEESLAKFAKIAAARPYYDRMTQSDEDFCLERLKAANLEKYILHGADMVYVNYEEFYGVVLDTKGYFHKLGLEDVKVVEHDKI